MNLKRNLLCSTAAFASVLAFQTSVAVAQDGADEKKSGIEEIIVTSRKKSENLQEAPLSVSAFTSNMIEKANIKSLDEVAKLTPGFSFDDEFGRTNSARPVIRGQSTILGASGVSTFVDGVLIGGSSLDYDLQDVERIEIIKGPQSALYGRNTYSGAINIITKSPTDETSGSIKVEAAEFDQYDVSFSVRGPISDQISGSLTGRYYERGGPFLNTYDNTEVGQQESQSLSGVLYFEPNDKLDIRFRARWSKLQDDAPRLFVTDPADNNCFQDDGFLYGGNGRYICGEITELPIAIDDVRLLGEKGYSNVESWETSLSIDYAINDKLTITSINGYNSGKSDEKFDGGYTDESLHPFSLWLGFPLFSVGPIYPGSGDFWGWAYVNGGVTDFASSGTSENWDASSETRISYQSDGWDAMLGGYYYKGNSQFDGNRTAPPGFEALYAANYAAHDADATSNCMFGQPFWAPCLFGVNFSGDLEDQVFNASRDHIESQRENGAVFASLSRDVTEDLSLSAEGRYSKEKVTSIRNPMTADYDYQGNLIGMTEGTRGLRTAVFSDFNPRFTAKYKASENVNVYAVAARGTKPGGFNNSDLASLGLDRFDEETVWSFEGGVKTTLLDNSMVFNVAIYQNTINGYHLTESVINPVTNDPTTVTKNAGKARIKGVELDMVYAPASVDGLVLNMNYALADTNMLVGTDINEGKLLDTVDDGLVNCSIGYAVGSTDCNSGDNVLPGSIVGRQLPRQAKHMFNAGASYTTAIDDTWNVTTSVNMSYESKKYVQVHNLAWVGAATLVNASIAFENDEYRISIWAKNLTNEDSVVSASRFTDEAQNFQRAFMGNPRMGRQFGVTGSFKF